MTSGMVLADLVLAGLRPYLIATAIGLGVGLERDWSNRGGEQQAAGPRSFALLGLAGVLTRSFSLTFAVVGAAIVGALLVAGYVRTASTDKGTTTESAAFAVFLLGVTVWTDAELAVGLAVVVAVLLASRAPLHRLARELVTETEITDALRFFVIAFVVLPLLPDRAMGPYGVLNPSKIWLLVVAVTGLGWVGYVAVRALGPERGLLITGFAGGFISATATTAALGRRARVDPALSSSAVAGALLASGATFIQLGLVTAVANRSVMLRLLPTLAAGTVTIAAESLALYRVERRTTAKHLAVAEPASAEPASATPRPFALRPAVALAGALTTVLLVTRWGSSVAGTSGVLVAAGIAGFADVHAAVLSVATLAGTGSFSMRTTLLAAGLALLTNTTAKVVLAFAVGGRAFGTRFTVLLAAPVAVTSIVLLLTLTP